MHFRYIGGKLRIPSKPSLLQTDGSYRKNLGRVAMTLYHESLRHNRVEQMAKARDSYETEWFAVYRGLIFSLEKNATEIHIENDNVGVVQYLTEQKKKHPYAEYYKDKICQLTKQTKYTGIRWIPRKFNRADDLFHKTP